MRSQGCQSRASVSFMSPSPARVDDVGEGAPGPQQGPENLTVTAPGPARAIRSHGQRALVTDGGIVRPRAMAVLRLITSSNRMFVSSSRRPSRSVYLTSANTLKGAGFRVCARPAAITWPRRRAAWRDQPRN
jgi:hypothetical protein